MNINVGTKLGSYEIVSRIGAGGMGEVWRARDPKIGRDVAIKVLPASFSADADRLQRFEQEARAAGTLNHPNLVTIFELGSWQGSPFIAMELLEGETLREKLDEGAIPPRKAVEYAVQMANGLAAAHSKGIVHRDLKPENVFATDDGRIKILDFGLAKLTAVETPADDKTAQKGTAPGAVMGTAGYMSPEQVRGQQVDSRTDIFAFGAMLYEMISGRRAFKRESSVETMNAILKEDPPELSGTGPQVSPALDRITRRCLEKNANERFQSARDLAFALDAVNSSGSHSELSPTVKPRRRFALGALAGAAIVALLTGVALDRLMTLRSRAKAPNFRQMTFARGIVSNARFSPDGKTIVYDGAFNGAAPALFTTRDDAPEGRPLLEGSRLLAVSSKGELAVLVRPQLLYHFQSRGTLARVALSGGRPREIVENVREADWSPDGSELAVIRDEGGVCRLEFPAGHVLYSTTGYLSHLRVSPDGKRVAFYNHQIDGDDRGSLDVVDLAGHRSTLYQTGGAEEGLAWQPGSNEIWFTAASEGTNLQLRTVSLRGQMRTILGTPGAVILQDIAADGRLLLCRDLNRSWIYARGPADAAERDVSWLDQSLLDDLSNDGRLMAFTEQSEAMGPTYAVCIRDVSGGAPIRLGAGNSGGLSPDGRNVISHDPDTDVMMALPTGAGEPRRMPLPPGFRTDSHARWLPNGTGVVVFGRERGRNAGYIIDFPGGKAKLIGGISGFQDASHVIPNPDGRSAAIDDRTTGKLWIVYFNGSPARPVSGARPFERAVQWADSNTLYVRPARQVPAAVDLLDLTTGQRRPWKTVGPADRAGQQFIYNMSITPDGSSYVYDVNQELTDLFLVDGLR